MCDCYYDDCEHTSNNVPGAGWSNSVGKAKGLYCRGCDKILSVKKYEINKNTKKPFKRCKQCRVDNKETYF